MRLIFAARLERHGIDTLLVKQAQIPIRLATNKVSGRKLTGVSGGQSFGVGFGMAIILFVAILMFVWLMPPIWINDPTAPDMGLWALLQP